jgi:hypothetical protein
MAVKRFGRIAAAKIKNPEIVVELERIRKNISDKENQFEAKREAFTSSAGRIRVPDALQRQAGRIDVLLLVDGPILYTLLLRDWDIELIKQELSHRGLSTEGGWKKGIIARLKESEGNAETFMPTAPHVSFDYIFDVWWWSAAT